MARQARLILPGHPHHVLVRGNNRQSIFVDDEDRRRLLSHLAEVVREQSLALHAYVLMPDHLHLLATPQSGEALGRAMQSLGRRYVGAFNHRHRRSGTLWEGRFELNPQRVGLAIGLDEYGWSSLIHHLGGPRDPLITEPPAYWALGNTPFDREASYRGWIEQGVSTAEAQRMVAALISGRPLGDASYVAELEKLIGRSLAPGRRGRPKKTTALAGDYVPN
jgi:putative transposase